jgi:hypothetical protein
MLRWTEIERDCFSWLPHHANFLRGDILNNFGAQIILSQKNRNRIVWEDEYKVTTWVLKINCRAINPLSNNIGFIR